LRFPAPAETDAGERPGLTSDERAELARLRRENRSLREDVEVLKRATVFCEGDPMKAHPFIGAEKAAGHGIARACRLLKVSRAAYYQRLRGVHCARRTADVILSAKITSLHIESKGTYGSSRVHQMLRRDGSCGKRRVARLMRAAGLEGRRKKRWRTTTIADPAAERARDLIQRDFAPRPSPGLPQARHLPVPAPENGNSASEPPALGRRRLFVPGGRVFGGKPVPRSSMSTARTKGSAEGAPLEQHIYATTHVNTPIWYSYYTPREPDWMEFEFDPAKSASNLEKHRIDFDAVQAIWQDVMRVEIPARTADEPRWLVVRQIDGKHWSVVVTYREQRVRIISARRSRKEEVALYEG
jgi:uncharacterized DUF497 family protein